MNRTIVAVADAARARIYTYDRIPEPLADQPPELRERIDLINPERQLRPRERHGDAPGTGVTPGGQGFGIDDHRAQHERDLDHRFATTIAAQLTAIVREIPRTRVVVVASPNMMGQLRTVTGSVAARGIEIHEVQLDLTHESTPQLHDHLAGLGVLPPRSRLTR